MDGRDDLVFRLSVAGMGFDKSLRTMRNYLGHAKSVIVAIVIEFLYPDLTVLEDS
jgi:hypothetical protein